jgi:predicted N-acyltransferase
MPDGNDRLSVTVLGSITEIAPDQWDACAGGGNPFVTHAFLDALERSGSANAATGWLPRHLVVHDADGKVVACAPLYGKSHSYGEYVFDWAWAEAYTKAGGRYYPKLQCAVPFTPVTGPRLMVRPGAGEAHLRALLIAGMVELAERLGVSSLHVTFPTEAEADILESTGFLRRLGVQYHWENRDYGDFAAFLADLSSRKRKQVRKEREAVARAGLTIATLVGDDVKPRHWDAFHRFYCRVIDRKWGSAYLKRAFFEELSAGPLAKDVVLVWAEDDGEPLACAFNMKGGNTLYGRTWGAATEMPFLHFEACYYRALDFAIAHGLKQVEAGAQGEHKVSRGYLPTATHSAHWVADPGFRTAIARYLDHERPLIAEDMAEQTESGPFRKD